MNEQKFPKELLTKPPNERLEFFKNHTVTHPLFEEIFQDLLYAIQDVQPGTLIFLFGPSGVGKTTMLKLMEAVLTKQMLRQLEKDLNLLPVVRINSVASEAGNFDWKDFFQRLLAKLNDPLPERKLDLEYLHEVYNKNASLLEKTGYINIKKYRRAIESAIKYRKPSAIMVDEAQHIGKVVSSRKLLDQLNVIKCLANDTDSIYVMSGTYELTPFLNLNDQVSRRSINIQFPRYKLENEGEQEMFINALRSFQEYLPLEQMPDLVSRWDYFYERTIGCIGSLNDWLERALSLSLRDGGAQMKPEHWEKRAPLLSQCQKKFSQIQQAEDELREDESSWTEFRDELWKKSKATCLNSNETTSKDGITLSEEIKSSKRKKRVGVRNPHRDPIGKNARR